MYKKQNLVRLAVRDVQKRGQQLDKKRKQQGKAYSAVKSKVAGNMKVIDRTNKELGYNMNRYQPKKTLSQSVAQQSIRKFVTKQVGSSPSRAGSSSLRGSLSTQNIIDLRKSQMK